MKYQLVALALITFQLSASQVKTNGIKYPEFNHGFISQLPTDKAAYYKNEIYKVRLFCHYPNKSYITYSPRLIEEYDAVTNCIKANQELLKKNNSAAVKLLKQSLCLDRAKILLAYCYRYGIGTKIHPTAASILLDLANPHGEDREDLTQEIKYLFHTIKLGL